MAATLLHDADFCYVLLCCVYAKAQQRALHTHVDFHLEGWGRCLYICLYICLVTE